MQLRRALRHLLRPTWRRCVAAALLYTATAHLGAGIFYAIEGGEERARAVAFQEQLQQRRELVEAALVNDTTARAALDALVSQLDEYAYAKQSAPNPDALNWSFGGSLFFVLTIMTTIGYGTFVPYTLAGEVLVVVFGLFGLAVSGACLTVLADGLDKARGAGPPSPTRKRAEKPYSPLRRASRCSSACFASTSPVLGGAPSSTPASRSPTGCSAEASLPRRRAGTSSPASAPRSCIQICVPRLALGGHVLGTYSSVLIGIVARVWLNGCRLLLCVCHVQHHRVWPLHDLVRRRRRRARHVLPPLPRRARRLCAPRLGARGPARREWPRLPRAARAEAQAVQLRGQAGGSGHWGGARAPGRGAGRRTTRRGLRWPLRIARLARPRGAPPPLGEGSRPARRRRACALGACVSPSVTVRR